MNSSQFSDQLAVMSEHYPVGVTTQFVSEEGAAENAKPRRRRRKSKGGEGGGGLSKRKLSEEQFSMLERSFGSEHKLESERKDRLAAELGLDPRQVAVWFQNRRARWKAKKMEEEYAKLRSQLDSTVVEKCRLETEVVKMKEQLDEAEREIQRLSERWKGFTSNSPASSSLSSMEANVEPHFLGEFGMGDVFYVLESNDAHGFEWDDRIYYM